MLLAATRIAVSGVRRSWPERRQQRRLQLLALARQLGRLALLEELRALDRDRHDAGERVERAGLDGPARGGEQADGLGADPQRHEPNRAAVDRPSSGGRRRCGRRRRTRAWSGPRRRPWRAARLSRAIVAAPGFEHVPVARARQRNRDELQVEPPGDRARQHRDRLAAVGHDQHVAAQVEQARQLVPAPQRFLRARARHGRQVAGHEADGQEREQGDPVLRVGNGQGADRRQEEEVEAEHRDDRRRRPRPRGARWRRPRGRPAGTSSTRSPRSTRAAIGRRRA